MLAVGCVVFTTGAVAAATLILYCFAVAAVSLGVFSFLEALGTFATIVTGELV